MLRQETKIGRLRVWANSVPNVISMWYDAPGEIASCYLEYKRYSNGGLKLIGRSVDADHRDDALAEARKHMRQLKTYAILKG